MVHLHVSYRCQPRRRPRPQPVAHPLGAASTRHRPARVEVDDPRHQQRPVLGVGRQKRRLIDPLARSGAPRRARWSTRARRDRAQRPSPYASSLLTTSPPRRPISQPTRPDDTSRPGPLVAPPAQRSPLLFGPVRFSPHPRSATVASPTPAPPSIRHRQIAYLHPPSALSYLSHPSHLSPARSSSLHHQPPLAALFFYHFSFSTYPPIPTISYTPLPSLPFIPPFFFLSHSHPSPYLFLPPSDSLSGCSCPATPSAPRSARSIESWASRHAATRCDRRRRPVYSAGSRAHSRIAVPRALRRSPSS